MPAVLVPAAPDDLLAKVIAAAAEVAPPPEPPSEERADPLLPAMPGSSTGDGGDAE